jgi:hypothetical protein
VTLSAFENTHDVLGQSRRRRSSDKEIELRVVLAGLSARLAAGLKTGRCQVERTATAEQTLSALRRSPTPGAGDALAAVEADLRLAGLVPVVVVGERTALALALRTRGLSVMRWRGVARRLEMLLRTAGVALRQSVADCAHLSRTRSEAPQGYVRRSRRSIAQSRRLCTRGRGGAGAPGQA